MLIQLPTVRSRLGILDSDTTNDVLLTNAIQAISTRFDRECSRTLARTVDAPFEFSIADTELAVPCYPIETVTRFELKTSEALGWIEQPNVDCLIRGACVISLASALSAQCPSSALARVIYTGGFVMPDAQVEPGQKPLPVDLEQAALEQVAYWFQNRDRLGLLRIWDYHSTYRHFADLDLLTSVRAVLETYRRWNV